MVFLVTSGAMPGQVSLGLIVLLAVTIATICMTGSSAETEDEPLKQLFESFLPTGFLEKPVGNQESATKSKNSKVNDAKAEELMNTATTMVSGLQHIVNGLNAPDIGNCIFKCPNGVQPTPLPGFKPVPNGCGTHGLKIDVSDMPGITECCNSHDICYGTCNSGQLACDRQFNTCMADACERMRNAELIKTEKRFTECMAIGATFHLTAMALGCEFYRDSQRTACECLRPGQTGDDIQAKIRSHNREKRARATAKDDELEQVDLSSPVFDLPDAVDRDEL